MPSPVRIDRNSQGRYLPAAPRSEAGGATFVKRALPIPGFLSLFAAACLCPFLAGCLVPYGYPRIALVPPVQVGSNEEVHAFRVEVTSDHADIGEDCVYVLRRIQPTGNGNV